MGDIFISIEHATAQAEEYGNTLTQELCFLAVHGMLHLLGYDHMQPEEEQVMRQKTAGGAFAMRFLNSLNHAFDGIVHAFKTEGNMKIHFVIALLTVIASVLTYSTRYEMIALSITIAFVFMAELINTAIEAVVDLITEKYHELAKIAKNVAAGAVLIAALNALVVAYLIFYRKLTNLSFASLDYLVNLPVHLTFAALVVVGLVVIIIKSRSVHKKGSYIHGGMPSGHSALAFSLFASMSLVAQNTLITFLARLWRLSWLRAGWRQMCTPLLRWPWGQFWAFSLR